MKTTKLLSLVVFVILSLSLSSCNKDAKPVVLIGSWQLDTNATFLQVVYDDAYKKEHLSTYNYLNENKERILKEIKKPDIIQFTESNTVDFIYTKPLAPTIGGTFTQFDIYVNITNSLFPNGVTGASNNKKLEIYYPKEYMMGILYSMLTAEDDPPENFNQLIQQFDGVGVYTRAK